MADERTDEEIYPGVKHAYDVVMPSYQLLTVRVESAVGRIQALMTFAATMSLGVPSTPQGLIR